MQKVGYEKTYLSWQYARQWADLGCKSKKRTLWTWNGAILMLLLFIKTLFQLLKFFENLELRNLSTRVVVRL